jgi:hypothetical protein
VPREHLRQVRDAAAAVADDDLQQLRRALTFHREAHAPAAAVAERVAHDLRHGRGDADLILRLEADELGDVAGPLPGCDHVGLAGDDDAEKREAHSDLAPPRAGRTTSTDASSR